MPVAYPLGLRTIVRASKVRDQPASFRMTEPRRGYGYVEKIGTDTPIFWSVVFRFSQAEAASFRRWFVYSISRGADEFTMPIKTEFGLLTYTVRFLPESLLTLRETGEVFEYQATIMARAETVVLDTSSCEYDPNWPNVILLLHFDGAVGAATFTDSSSFGNTINFFGSAGSLTEVKSKFGQAYKPPTATSNSYFSISLGSKAVMAGDFTFQWWSHQSNNNVIWYASAGGYVYNGFFEGYGSTPIALPTTNLIAGQLEHFVIQRSGGNLACGRNGLRTSQIAYASSLDFSSLQFGRFAPNNNLYFDGYYDEVKITRSVAVYPTLHTTGTYTVPTKPTCNGF